MNIEEKISPDWAAKYPFTRAAKQYIRLFTPPLEEFSEKELEHIWDYGFKRAVYSVKGEPLIKWGTDEDEIIATSFPLALAIVKATKNPIIYARFTNGESKRAFRLLLNDAPENVVYIAKELKIRAEYIGNSLYKVYFIDYIKVASKIADKKWKLVNNFLKNGYVVVNQRRICRIISEHVRNYVLDKLTEEWKVLNENFMELTKKLIEKFGKPSQLNIEKQLIDREVKNFPPCMRQLYETVISGGNPSHIARFALTAFMLRIGYKVDEIIIIFGQAADFNEKIARYQIEHIAGERGGRKKYFVPSCEKMRLYGLCFPDEFCEKIRNPIQYLMVKRKHEKGL